MIGHFLGIIGLSTKMSHSEFMLRCQCLVFDGDFVWWLGYSGSGAVKMKIVDTIL